MKALCFCNANSRDQQDNAPKIGKWKTNIFVSSVMKISAVFKLLLEAYIIFNSPYINFSSSQHAFPTEKGKENRAERRSAIIKKQKPGLY